MIHKSAFLIFTNNTNKIYIFHSSQSRILNIFTHFMKLITRKKYGIIKYKICYHKNKVTQYSEYYITHYLIYLSIFF